MHEPLEGPVVGVNVGWAPQSIGVIGHLSYLHLSGDHSTYRPFVIGIGLLLQDWDVADAATR